ncbi:VWA domain-containing protein [Paraliomyxa miuraensis]|uniref:VWA domain-containing protein n=1 Tax=Paraliomyxa miuraensis TaxID=376150 RepID=UPI00225C19E4|nr:VWA domain-containing protein [Paraliomyxa miuraensis]MCX4243110.1 VWA domain-containing protein [Paraliomyxa miuraensis]
MIELLHRWFYSPQWLWLIPALLPLLAWDTLRTWDGAAHLGRRVAGAFVRFVMLAALAAALADPRWHRNEPVAHVIMVVDRSASIPDDALSSAMGRIDELRRELREDVVVGLVLFDDDPEIAVFPGDAWEVPSPLRGESPVEVSDIDEALQLALGLIPADEGGEIVLFSDGRATGGSTAASFGLRAATERGIAVHAIPLAPHRADPAVTAVALTQREVRPGATVEGTVELDGATQATSGTVEVALGDEVILRARVQMPAEQTIEVPFSHQLPARAEPGTTTVTATFTPDDGAQGDPDPTNNQGVATLVVGEPPKVRMIAGSDADAESLAKALRAERMDVEVVPIEALEPTHAEFSAVDLVVLANAPALAAPGGKAMDKAFIESLGRYVDAGGGLVVLGGPQAYDMGGYRDTDLARVLPVRLDQVDPEIESAATIVIILDKSGSMSAYAGLAKTKMELADEGAAASVRLLRPFDRIAVMSVTEDVFFDVPLQSVHSPKAIENKILEVRAGGGGIYVYTALEAAREVMKKTDTPLRHVILFSDAADSEEKMKGVPFGDYGTGPRAEDLARSMRSDGITTSVIGIGEEFDSDKKFLEDLAAAGGGRFYLTNDAAKLRGLFVEETERLVDSSLHEIKFRPEVRLAHPTVAGIDYQGGPQLRGYQEMEARSTAEVVLTGPNGDPLLTTWRYGLGQVAAWSSDSGPRWSEDWLAWEGYGKQWTQIARWALRSRAGDETAIEVDFEGGRAQVRVARRGKDGLTLDEGGLRARIDDGTDTTEVALRSGEPGMWTSQIRTRSDRTYRVEVVDDKGTVLASDTFAPPPSPERRHRTIDAAWLAGLTEQTGGQQEPTALHPTPSASLTTSVQRLWPWLLLLALCLLPLDAFLRRPGRVV